MNFMDEANTAASSTEFLNLNENGTHDVTQAENYPEQQTPSHDSGSSQGTKLRIN
jgi:hypothetical protein